MSDENYFSQFRRKYKICYIHNPKHFFLNTLYVENLNDGRKALCAKPRPHNKHFKIVAILKPKGNKEKRFVKENTLSLKKPFAGIFRDE